MIAARDLPDTDNTFFNISRGDWTDPFVTVFLDQVNSALNASSMTTGQTLSSPSFLIRLFPVVENSSPITQIQVELLKTSWFENCLDPEWDEVYTIPVCHSASAIRIKVMDREHIGAEEVGKILISTDDIVSGEPLEGWYPLTVSNGGDVQGAVHIAIQLFPPLALSVGKVLDGGYFQV